MALVLYPLYVGINETTVTRIQCVYNEDAAGTTASLENLIVFP